jgi:hypothetical protein
VDATSLQILNQNGGSVEVTHLGLSLSSPSSAHAMNSPERPDW